MTSLPLAGAARAAPRLPVQARSGAAGDLSPIAGLLLLAAVLFNAALAVINAHVMPLTTAIVVVAEAAIVAGAYLVVAARFRREMVPWCVLIGVLAVIALIRSIALGEIEVKYLRDVLIIPTFILLGMTFDERHLTRLVVVIHAVVLVFLVLEAVDTDAYSALFKIQDYYINTRGYEQEDFWNRESDLYVSATRPDERFFSFVDLHRLSSVFLEPVSLGNYCIIVVAFLCARFQTLGTGTRLFLILGTLLALIGCDGRLAGMSALVMVAVSVVAPRLPRGSAALYLPGVTLLAFLLVIFAGFQAGPDNFSGRIAHTVELLERYDVPELLGASNRYLSQAVDSGLAYLVTTQSVIGVAVLWLFVVLASGEETPEQIRHTHALCVYMALTMMVSFAFLSIKTAALLWFVHGSLQRGPARPAPAPGQGEAPGYRFGRALRRPASSVPAMSRGTP